MNEVNFPPSYSHPISKPLVESHITYPNLSTPPPSLPLVPPPFHVHVHRGRGHRTVLPPAQDGIRRRAAHGQAAGRHLLGAVGELLGGRDRQLYEYVLSFFLTWWKSSVGPNVRLL